METPLNRHNIINLFYITVVSVLALLVSSCSTPASAVPDDLVITSLVAEHNTVYPVGNTRITCSAVSKSNDTLDYQWVAEEGTITGKGQTVTWEAPKTYGDFQIMCTVFDSQGRKISSTVAVSVIVRDPTKCCR